MLYSFSSEFLSLIYTLALNPGAPPATNEEGAGKAPAVIQTVPGDQGTGSSVSLYLEHTRIMEKKLGFRAPIMQNQMAKKIAREMKNGKWDCLGKYGPPGLAKGIPVMQFFEVGNTFQICFTVNFEAWNPIR